MRALIPLGITLAIWVFCFWFSSVNGTVGSGEDKAFGSAVATILAIGGPIIVWFVYFVARTL